jgi:tetratricopeptide (TPR) repeat protein
LAAPAAGFLALTLAAAPLMAQGYRPQPADQQRGGPPKEDTPYILITTFHSDDRKLGVDMAEELRKRVAQENSAKELYVIPKRNIDGTLEASGYKPDSALSASDLMELAKQLRGELVIDGTVNKTGKDDAVKLDVRVLMKAGQAILAQPLPVTEAKDPGDAAKQIEKAIDESNKALAQTKLCRNNMVAAKYPEAATAAHAALTAYPNSSFARVCLLQALVAQKAGPDQIIEVANQIKTQDPTSTLALANLSDAYFAKGDTSSGIQAMIGLWRLDRTNQQLVGQIINTLVNSGSPDQALPMVDTLLVNSPEDAQMMRTKWLLQLRAKKYKDALASGEAYVKAHPDSATVDYFQRQIGAAQSDSNATAVQELAAKAAAKYPKDPSFNLLLAQNQLKSGQVQEAVATARKATEADPKDPRGWQLMLAGFAQLKQSDSIVAAGKAAIAAGVPATELGASLASVANEAFQKAQASKTREDYQAALEAAQTVDAIAPSPQSAFFIGVSAYSVAADMVPGLQKIAQSSKKADAAEACTEAKQVEDLLTQVQISLPKGASVSKEAASQILGGIPQYSTFIDAVKKARCPKS